MITFDVSTYTVQHVLNNCTVHNCTYVQFKHDIATLVQILNKSALHAVFGSHRRTANHKWVFCVSFPLYTVRKKCIQVSKDNIQREESLS